MPIRGAPGIGINTIRSPLAPLAPAAGGRVRVSQQYLEVISPSAVNHVRLSQQYLEIITEFGSPPPTGPGKSGGSPGHNKPPQATAKWIAFQQREQLHRNRRTGRFSSGDVNIFDVAYLPTNPDPIRFIETTKTVRIG